MRCIENSTPLIQDDKWTNASSNHRPSNMKIQRKEKIGYTCDPPKQQALTSTRNKDFKPVALRGKQLMFDDESDVDSNNDKVGLFTSRNDMTIDSIPLAGINAEIQKISIDHITLTE